MNAFKKIFIPTLVLMIIAGVSAAILSFTYTLWGVEALENAGLNEAELAEYGARVLPTAQSLAKVETSFTDKKFVGAYQDDSTGQIALYIKTKGYGGDIGVLVGFDSEGVIQGVVIVSSSETPNIGTKIENEEYLANYIGQQENVDEVDTVATATVSSKALKKGLNYAMSILEDVKGGIN